MINVKQPSGRPKKAEADKVKYQRIAVYKKDYSKLVKKIDKHNKNNPSDRRIKLTDAFSEMVKSYTKK